VNYLGRKKNCSCLIEGRRYIGKNKLFMRWKGDCCFLFFVYISAASFHCLPFPLSLASFPLFVLVFFDSSLIRLFVQCLFAHYLYPRLYLSSKVYIYNQLLEISTAEEILATYIFDDETGFSGCWVKVNKFPSNDRY